MTLEQYFKLNNLDDKQFAKMLGVSRVHVHYLLTGQRNASDKLKLKIKEITKGDVTPNDLVKEG